MATSWKITPAQARREIKRAKAAGRRPAALYVQIAERAAARSANIRRAARERAARKAETRRWARAQRRSPGEVAGAFGNRAA